MAEQKESLSVDEAADVLKVGVPTIEALIADGALRAAQQQGETRVRYEDLLDYMRASQRASTEDGDSPADGLGAALP